MTDPPDAGLAQRPIACSLGHNSTHKWVRHDKYPGVGRFVSTQYRILDDD